MTYRKDTIETMGTCVLNCKISDITSPIEFQVVHQNSKSNSRFKRRSQTESHLISHLYPDVHEINTSSLDRPRNPPNIPIDIWQEHSDLFSDTPGCLPIIYKIKLNPDITPVARPPRKVPHAMKDKIKDFLDKTEENEIIAKVSEPTEWVSTMVAAKKKNNDELRICIDPRDLNMALMRPHHQLKTLDKVASSNRGATMFSILDAKSAFWHIKLDEQSSYYTTFNSVFGPYRYLRMPYDISSGSEVYQQAIESLMEGTPFKAIADDILVYGTNMAEHDANLKIVLRRLHKINLRLNVNKCKFRITEVKYVGNVFTSNGLLPDTDKVSAINNMPASEDKQRITTISRYDQLPLPLC